MPMSIRFHDQGRATPDWKRELEVKRPSRSHKWFEWVPGDSDWRDLGSKAKAHISGYVLHIDPRVVPHTAAVYLEEVLPGCDGYHVLVTYQWVNDREVFIGVVRSRAPFTAGKRVAPAWAHLRRSAWERLRDDEVPV